ncbi:MAG: hypothetical protein DRP56_01800 [Planctomycetota bacterium]|nr:MAG: hypothetical protein DRP56_01800 [Planctomycetota bacterium]
MAEDDEKTPLCLSGGQISGGMKMAKYVHCTVVETRVCGRIPSNDTEAPDADPYPQSRNLNNAYQMQSNCYFHSPTTLDFRA